MIIKRPAPMATICNIKKLVKLLWVLVSVSLGSFNLITSDSTVTPSSPQSMTQKTANQQDQLVGTVEVSFKITEEGKADIISIKSNNPALIKYIKTKLNKINLEKDDFNIDEVITYKLVFGEQNA